MWDEYTFKPREGVLSQETMFSLTHTLCAMKELTGHLTRDMAPYEYVCLGKFTTEPLERRFGMYRTFAGSNYHISLQNILECEKNS